MRQRLLMTVKNIAVARTDWLSWLLQIWTRDFVTHRPPGMVFDDDIFPTNKNRRYKRECIANTMKKPNKRREGYLASRVGKVHWRRGRRSIARGRRSRSIAACGSCRKASGNLGTSRSAEPTAAAEVVADWCRRSRSIRSCSNCWYWPVGSRGRSGRALEVTAQFASVTGRSRRRSVYNLRKSIGCRRRTCFRPNQLSHRAVEIFK